MDPAIVDYDRFRVEQQAGSGAMGVVYLARDTLTGGSVALKVLRSTAEGDSRRFLREARALAELNHPGIVRYVAHGESRGERWLAMEWLEGETLAMRLQRQGLTIAESVAVVARAADAVGALHQRGMLHRDLKPSNLFLVKGEIDRLKVLDFGLARFGARSAELSMTGILVGTPNYMSPEQAQGAKTVDSRADVFALGCVLFKCLTGHAPFQGSDATRVLTKLLFEEAPRLVTVLPKAPPELDALLSRALSRNMDERPSDASVLAAQLRALRGLEGGERAIPLIETRAPALTGTEQRLFALLVAGDSYMVSIEEATHVHSRRGAGLTTAALLRTTVGVNGGLVEEQNEELIVATFDAHGTPSDLAVQAARCALAVTAIRPDLPLSLTMGWARGKTGWRESEVTTRAREQLAVGHDRDGHARVVIDRMVANLLDARFDVTADSPHVLRAERELAGPARTLLGKPSPCVGREREITLLQSTYDEACVDSRARVAVVTSPAGGGKSRLRHELFRRLRERGDPAEVWSARGDPMSAGSPFGLLAPAIRKLANILDGEPEIVRQQKLRARVSRYVREEDRGRITDFIGELAGVHMSDAGSVVLRTARENPLTMGDQIARAFEDWLSAECDVRPIILAIDDMQWGDWSSARLVDGALRNLANKPLFVLMLARPEVDDVMPGLFKERDALTLRLGPIGKKAAETLSRALLGALADAATVARVVALAAGNVFYLEELIRAVAEGRGDALPDTVVAMVQQRTKALEPEARRVLRAASVFGQAFWRDGVLTLLGGPQHAEMVDDVLDELVSIELVGDRAESRFPGDREYTFRHSLVRDGAYALLTDEDRQLGHKLAATWLESSGEPNDRVLAEHFERGGVPSRARSCWGRAAEQALEGNDFAGAIEGCRRGEACGAVGEERGRLALTAARAHRWRAELPEHEAAALLAMTLLPRHGREWLDAVAEAAPAACRLGHADVLESLARELQAVDADAKRTAAFAGAAGNLGVQLTWMGKRQEAKALLALIDASDKKELLVEAWGHRLRSFIAQFEGDGPAYLRGSELASDAFERAGDRRLSSGLQVAIGFALTTLGRYHEAEQRLREALALAVRIGLPTIVALAKQNLGIALARSGRLVEGRQLQAESAAEALAQRDRRIESGSRSYLAEILISAGELDAAFAEASRSYEISSEPAKALALALMGEARRRQGKLDEALERSEAAMDLLARLGGIEEGSVLVRLIRARVLFAIGRADDAFSVLEEATREIGARANKLTEGEARRAFLENVPEHREALQLAAEWSR